MSDKTFPEHARNAILAPEFAGAKTWGTEANAQALAQLEALPASDRIEQLFASMRSEHRLLLAIMNYCREAKAVTDVNAMVDELTTHNRCVYTPGRLCALLERAGALRRIGGDGGVEPERVELDGEAYWKPVIADATQWETTAEGEAALAADDPQARFRTLLEKDAAWAGAYLTVLDLCAAEGGANAAALSAALDDHPALQRPRRFAAYFYDRLDSCDCIAWTSSWTITDTGRAVASELREEGIVPLVSE